LEDYKNALLIITAASGQEGVGGLIALLIKGVGGLIALLIKGVGGLSILNNLLYELRLSALGGNSLRIYEF